MTDAMGREIVHNKYLILETVYKTNKNK
jgi:hypothetical protein